MIIGAGLISVGKKGVYELRIPEIVFYHIKSKNKQLFIKNMDGSLVHVNLNPED